ncbi:MAG TPA: HAD family hydrolase [Micropepsaceae bacterium]|nr:HAD family hydrolase [Micropepsaceae bacterium]
MTPPALVIFDCDGVLVDSEAIANDTLAEALTALGLPMSGAEARRRFVGLSFASVCRKLTEEHGLELPAGWADEVEARDFAAFRARLKPVPGVRQLIAAVDAAGIKKCVASSGSFAKMDVTLGVTGLRLHFDGAIFNSSQVARGKPAPDLFLHAARMMGVPPEQALVIEDSVYGVMGARAAGMRVIGYCGDPATDRTALASAGAEIVTGMAEVPRLIGIG